MSFKLHNDGPCLLCKGEEYNMDFDYCRACGFTLSALKIKKQEPPPKGTLGRAVWDARGGPPPPLMQRGFA